MLAARLAKAEACQRTAVRGAAGGDERSSEWWQNAFEEAAQRGGSSGFAGGHHDGYHGAWAGGSAGAQRRWGTRGGSAGAAGDRACPHRTALGLPQGCTISSAEVRAALRRAALAWHPDRQPAGASGAERAAAEARFKAAAGAADALAGGSAAMT